MTNYVEILLILAYQQYASGDIGRVGQLIRMHQQRAQQNGLAERGRLYTNAPMLHYSTLLRIGRVGHTA
jgi:hypothetical protein